MGGKRFEELPAPIGNPEANQAIRSQQCEWLRCPRQVIPGRNHDHHGRIYATRAGGARGIALCGHGATRVAISRAREGHFVGAAARHVTHQRGRRLAHEIDAVSAERGDFFAVRAALAVEAQRAQRKCAQHGTRMAVNQPRTGKLGDLPVLARGDAR